MHGHCSLVVLLMCCSLGSACLPAQSHAPPPPVGGIGLTDVIRLSQAGLSDSTIIAQIKRRPQPFNLSPDDLLQLKAAHVSNSVIDAMMGAAITPPMTETVPQPSSSSKPATPQPVYR